MNLWMILSLALWIVVVFLCLIVWGVLRQIGLLHKRLDGLQKTRNHESGLVLNTDAPDFDLPKAGGGSMGLRDLRGKATLLAFVHPNCGPCKKLLPQLDALAARLNSTAAQIVLISSGEPAQNARMQVEHGLTLPLLNDVDAEVAERYQSDYTPYVFALDKHGVVRAHQVVNTEAQLIKLLQQIGPEAAEQLPHISAPVAAALPSAAVA